MQLLSPAGQQAVSDLAHRYNLSPQAIEHMLLAVNNGAGSMAQFNCPELGGSGQWMRGGMIMVGDMFNYGLKATVDNLCNELSDLLACTQVFPVLPAGTPGSHQWWPGDLGAPFSSGGQNNTRYAVFAGRLAVELNGCVTVYNTLDHQIGGVSQQQGSDSSLTFSSQYGTMVVSSLPVVSGAGQMEPANSNFAQPQPSAPVDVPDNQFVEPAEPAPEQDVTAEINDSHAAAEHVESTPAPVSTQNGEQLLALIEKLAQLHSAGVLSDGEFATKKEELLARL